MVDTRFIDSSIINAIREGDRLMRSRDRRLILYLDAVGRIKRLLEVTTLLDEVVWSVSLDDAFTYAQGRAAKADSAGLNGFSPGESLEHAVVPTRPACLRRLSASTEPTPDEGS